MAHVSLGLVDRHRSGAALALVLLLILALSGLGMGGLTLARRQAVAARHAGAILQATLAAEAGLRSLAGAWPSQADSMRTDATVSWSASVGGTGTYVVLLRRLGRELFFARSTGHALPGGARAHAAVAAWRLDPLTRVERAPAVVVHGSGLLFSDQGSVHFHAEPGADLAQTCEPWRIALDAHFDGRDLPEGAPLPGPPSTAWDGSGEALLPFEPADSLGRPGLGAIPLDSLVQAARQVNDRLAAPADECGTGDRPCPPPGLYRLPDGARAVTGSVRGVLVVDGDATLSGDAIVEGWVLVGGDLVVEGSALIRGLIRAGGRVEVGESGRVEGHPCLAAATLDTEWFRRPRVLTPAGGIDPPG